MRSFASVALAAPLALALSAPAFAGGTNGATPFNFIFSDAGARPVALGGAYAAAAGDGNALLYNPAGLGALDANEVVLMHNQAFQGVTQEYGALARKMPGEGSRGWGLMVDSLSFGSIQRTTLSSPDGSGLGTFGIREWAVAGGYGRNVIGGLSLGIAGKGFYETIDNASAFAPAVDAGLLYDFTRIPLSFGLAVQNFGPKVKFQLDREELPLNIRTGLAYRWSKEGLVVFDANQPRTGATTLHAGVEYVTFDRFALRLGYNGRNQADSGVTLGFGIRIAEASVDYAFVPFGDLGDSHRLSLSLRWGAGPRGGQARAQDAPVPGSVEDHFAKADSFIADKNYAMAKQELSAADGLLGPEDRRRIRYDERLGTVAWREKDVRAACGSYTEALRRYVKVGLPDSAAAEVYAGMGACLAAQKNAEFAVKYLNKALELDPSPETRRFIEGKLRELKGR